jgi:hypothetical protein
MLYRTIQAAPAVHRRSDLQSIHPSSKSFQARINKSREVGRAAARYEIAVFHYFPVYEFRSGIDDILDNGLPSRYLSTFQNFSRNEQLRPVADHEHGFVKAHRTSHTIEILPISRKMHYA